MLKYYKNVVKYNENVQYGLGIITGWKSTDMILNHLSEEAKKKIVTCGNLYTKNGINYIIANLFLNPHITELIVLEDSSLQNEMAEGISAFLQFLKTNELTFEPKFQFTEENLLEFSSYFKNHIRVVKRKDLEKELEQIKKPKKDWCKITEIEENPLELQHQIPSEKVGFTVRANTVYEAWNRALKLIHTYGYFKPSDYDENQLELINLSMIIRNEDLSNPSMDGVIDVTKEELEEYEKNILSKAMPDGVKYTYGNRYRDQNGKDQFQYMVDTLREKPFSRRAVATLWVPAIDIEAKEGPCLDLYQAIIEGEYLHLLTYIRANDVYNGWPRNIYGILKIQEELCRELGYQKGYVNTIAGSAHIYERNFADLEKRLNEKSISFCEEDERGYFTVTIENQEIQVTFYSIAGKELRRFTGKSALELRNQCTFYISNIDHAFYLGQELMKAELALKNQLAYVQDAQLDLKAKKKTLKLK